MDTQSPIRLFKSKTGLPANILDIQYYKTFESGLMEYIIVQNDTNEEINDENSFWIYFTEEAEDIFYEDTRIYKGPALSKDDFNTIKNYVKKSYADKDSVLSKLFERRKQEWEKNHSDEEVNAIRWASMARFAKSVNKWKIEEKVDEFLNRLSSLTDDFVNNRKDENICKESMELKNLFDFINNATGAGAFETECIHEVQLSLLKWERFANRNDTLSILFKDLLDYFYKEMEDTYYGATAPLTSTGASPIRFPELGLPCLVDSGTNDGWQREPYLTKEGEGAYADVVRFEDPKTKKLLCITIEDNPRLLNARAECSLTDNQLESIKKYVVDNKAIIIFFNTGIGDGFFGLMDALDVKLNPREYPPKYCIEFTYNKDVYYINMNDMSYDKALKYYVESMSEYTADTRRQKNSYKIDSLRILKPKDMEMMHPITT